MSVLAFFLWLWTLLKGIVKRIVSAVIPNRNTRHLSQDEIRQLRSQRFGVAGERNGGCSLSRMEE